MKDQFVTWYRDPVDVLEHLVDADPGAVFRIFQACRNRAAAPQLWEWGIIVFASSLEIKDRVAGDTASLARQSGAELARRGEIDVMGKQPLVDRVWAMVYDDVIRLQLKSGDDAVLDAAGEQGGEHDGGEGDYPANHRPAATQIQLLHHLMF